jgi:hypothetical protein
MWFYYNNSATNSNIVSVKIIKKSDIKMMIFPALLKSTLLYASLYFLEGLPSFNNSREVGFNGKWNRPVVHPSKIK